VTVVTGEPRDGPGRSSRRAAPTPNAMTASVRRGEEEGDMNELLGKRSTCILHTQQGSDNRVAAHIRGLRAIT